MQQNRVVHRMKNGTPHIEFMTCSDVAKSVTAVNAKLPTGLILSLTLFKDQASH